MPLTRCPDCGNDVSDSARVCIHCGRPRHTARGMIATITDPNFWTYWRKGALFAIVAVIFGMCSLGQ